MTTLLAIDIIGGWRTLPRLSPKKLPGGRAAIFRRRDSRRCHGEIPCSAVSSVSVRALRPPLGERPLTPRSLAAQDKGPGGRYTPGPSSFHYVQGKPISLLIPVIPTSVMVPFFGIRWMGEGRVMPHQSPMYQQIADDLRGQIKAGLLAPGIQLLLSLSCVTAITRRGTQSETRSNASSARGLSRPDRGRGRSSPCGSSLS